MRTSIYFEVLLKFLVRGINSSHIFSYLPQAVIVEMRWGSSVFQFKHDGPNTLDDTRMLAGRYQDNSLNNLLPE
ncbi:MAG: hypothetical protein AAF572_18365 [Cyanobacteria bacterium P01_B01_bin.77]